uniref:Large ribosomal subunit protein bL21c n=1 Tax=Taenioma perpusillum TaxID=210852 RepID=A0A1Z1MR45_9FLOR|nr:ribosomal protein L21 [Taenioma perpusillum]ARW68426.1 ribosomal protein L21 [Taenioma perpusillum]
MTYAIVDVGGKQVWMEIGKFYDINYLLGNPGDKIYLNRVLFLCEGENTFKMGRPCLESNLVKTRILTHLKGRKLIIFKMKPKKNTRCKQGHRQLLTRLLVEEIV